MKDKKILFGTFIALLLLLTTGLSYAYFSTSVSGNNDAKDVVVETGTLKLVYTDSPEIVAEHIKPGWSTTKVVTVKNTGTLDVSYNLVWQELTNEITNNELVISASCERLNNSNAGEGTCESIIESPVGSNKIKKNISIESGITHKYTFTITFKEMNQGQDYNQNKKFNGVIGVEEYNLPTSVSFAEDSWKTIAKLVHEGEIDNYNVGDTKTVDLGTYGTHTLRVANTSTPSECSTSGFSQTACGFVLEFADIITTHNMNDTADNSGGWPASRMYTFVNNNIYNSLPTDLRNVIIDTTVVSGHGDLNGDTENFTSTDKLYLLAPKEIYTDWSSSLDTAKDLTRTLDYYTAQGVTTSNNRSGAKKKNGNTALKWWTRTASSDYYYDFFFVFDDGLYSTTRATNTFGVSPAFRIG